jgi:Spondin_N
MKRLMLALAAAAVATALVAGSARADDDDDGDDGATRTWSVTIANLTPPGSQPLSPPLFAVHTRKVDVWSVGEIANHGVAAIAEDANNAPLMSALQQLSGVKTVFTGAGGAIPPGESRTYSVQTSGRFNRLSVLTMLVNTNDAFTGLDSFRVGRESLLTQAYDAGSERNNELKAFIPGPCCGNPFVRDPEGQLIRHHEGIRGDAELSAAVYDWDGPAARITIQPVS